MYEIRNSPSDSLLFQHRVFYSIALLPLKLKSVHVDQWVQLTITTRREKKLLALAICPAAQPPRMRCSGTTNN
jgi:hypothetical protein